MKKPLIFSVLCVLVGFSSIGQTATEIDSLISILAKATDSRDIAKKPEAKRILDYGDNVLPLLATYFTDTTITMVNSDCQKVFLNKGEIAIILADRIEIMPYATLTGIQNCILSFCDGNQNLVEYYVTAIRRDIHSFQYKYQSWLTSDDRKSWFGKQKKTTKKKNKNRQ